MVKGAGLPAARAAGGNKGGGKVGGGEEGRGDGGSGDGGGVGRRGGEARAVCAP